MFKKKTGIHTFCAECTGEHTKVLAYHPTTYSKFLVDDDNVCRESTESPFHTLQSGRCESEGGERTTANFQREHKSKTRNGPEEEHRLDTRPRICYSCSSRWQFSPHLTVLKRSQVGDLYEKWLALFMIPLGALVQSNVMQFRVPGDDTYALRR